MNTPLTTKIKVKATGYYNSTNNRVCLLREGDVLESTSYDKEFDGWICETNDKAVWVEKENGKVLGIVLD
jgi:hypothetical protein